MTSGLVSCNSCHRSCFLSSPRDNVNGLAFPSFYAFWNNDIKWLSISYWFGVLHTKVFRAGVCSQSPPHLCVFSQSWRPERDSSFIPPDLRVGVKAPRPHGHSACRGATLTRRRPHGGVRMEGVNEKTHLSPACLKWATADLHPHAESREDSELRSGNRARLCQRWLKQDEGLLALSDRKEERWIRKATSGQI